MNTIIKNFYNDINENKDIDIVKKIMNGLYKKVFDVTEYDIIKFLVTLNRYYKVGIDDNIDSSLKILHG